jgi:hypothetical protein
MTAVDLISNWKLVAWQLVADGQVRHVIGADPTGFLGLTREGRAFVLTVTAERQAGYR